MTAMRRIGEFEVFPLGLGAMPLSIEDRPDREKAIEVIHHALDLGINHIDTAWAYYLAGGTAENGEEEHNEKLIGEALSRYDGDISKVTVASKSGHTRYLDWDNQPKWGQRGDSRWIIETGKQSRNALGVDSIDLYYYHRPDLNVNYKESLHALKVLLEEGVIKYAGVSNASVDQIKMAQNILQEKFVAVQNQFSPAVRHTEDTLNYCAKNGLAFLPWSPLGGFRNPELLSKDQPFEEVAKARGVSKQQVILAWELSKADCVIPIPGFRRFETLEDSVKAVDLELTAEELEKLG